MDVSSLFDEVVADIEADPELTSRSARRDSWMAETNLRERLREITENEIEAIDNSENGNPYLRSIEVNDDGEVEKVRLRIYSPTLKSKYHRTIRVSNGELDLEETREKAEELADQVEEKKAEQNRFEPELGTIGEYLMDEKGYNRQTAWLHENYEDRSEEAGVASLKDGDVGEVTAVESYNKTPFRFKVKFKFDPTEYDGEDGLEELGKEKALEMYPEARVTSSFVKTGINYARICLTID